ncbi:phospholipase A and acyltransferase 3-like [Clupea harengus]|uniref:Phospholipase A and acyltransferase 3-like n=1 Tax=Clupea harengus TaxID=7950 RepID=A0A6P8GV10_CLUHA|nr:phospholipase A and acyltransferase 3-like [Clupea harengus]XP_031443045.1 phospholipase A and acyltransferase 3-like [Clupea harengus]
MAPTLYDEKPEIGDLIEIFRGPYQHWAVYIGDGYVIHMAPHTEQAGGGAYSMMSMMCDRAIVKKEGLWEVVGEDEWKINNLLDEEYEPRPAHEILREAKSHLNKELPYCVFRGNCEHFATELRYGKPQSRQVRNVEVGIRVGMAAMVGVGLVAFAATMFGGGSKEKESKSKR